MSACISRHGEYGSHEPPSAGDDPFTCHRCGAFDEEAIFTALGEAEAALDRVEAEIVRAVELAGTAKGAIPLVLVTELRRALGGSA